MQHNHSTWRNLLRMPVLVAALGYLVDMYDLFLFSVVRVPSLTDLGVPQDQLLPVGVSILNWQLIGLLIGGIIWGIMGDKKGRLSVLFGSILMYSLANLANGLVQTVPQYQALRFIAGIGLAGELGAGITLVAELLPQRLRSYGAVIVSTMGVLGGILAFLVADIFEWRSSYFVGGVMGLVLLVLRIRVFESGLFIKLKEKKVARGDLMMILTNGKRLSKYIMGILVGIPMWFVVGVLMTFSPEFGSAHGLSGINAGKAVMLLFGGQAFGNMASGLVSQYFQSRKIGIGVFMIGSFLTMLAYMLLPVKTEFQFYGLILVLGFFNGYWTLFIIQAAELFGTNIRATVATTIPNFVRGTAVILTTAFAALRPGMGIISGGVLLASVSVFIALVALYLLQETYHKDMNYEE